MSFVARKIDSISHRVRTEFFRRTGRWAAHPLNHRRETVPRTDWKVLHEQVVNVGRELGFPVVDWPINLGEYRRFCEEDVRVPRTYAMGSIREKKCLEHFIAYKLLELNASDVYMDVASEASPYPLLFRRWLGLTAYSQDLSYAAGVRGNEIGSSADAIPMPNASMTKMSAQCAFEHFEGNADTGFMNEAARLLRPGGRCVIVPLYMGAAYLNVIDPVAVEEKDVPKDPEATMIGETNLGGRFERVYSPGALRRVIVPWLKYTLYRITGHEQITENRDDPVHRVRYALLSVRS